MAKNNVIGSLNKLPWYLPRDLKHFSSTTKGHTVIMGRNTYLSIVERLGKPLPERKNIVVSSQKDFSAPECIVVNTLDEALEMSPKDEEVFVIGGAQLYKSALPYAQRLYITHVEAEINGDAFFPEFNLEDWQVVSEEHHESDEKNQFGATFKIYERKK
ncbi:MAG: dihydrofolate reductase [Patescibacteria group bacterium]